MVEFKCTLTAEAVSRLYTALSCLAKFHEVLGISISRDELTLVSLNSTRTSSASVSLKGDIFFQSFHFKPDDGHHPENRGTGGGGGGEEAFHCQLYNRSLLSVFKSKSVSGPSGPGGPGGLGGGGRGGGSSGGNLGIGTASVGASFGGGGAASGSSTTTSAGGGTKHGNDSAIERCEIVLQDSAERVTSWLVISITARSGVKKTYKLTYEPVEVPRAIFDKGAATSRWTMSAYMLKSFTEYFGARTELLDIYSENGKASFTSYTEKIMKGNEVLKQPLQTTIDIDTLDFADFEVEDQMHIGISVKDFKAIVIHAESLRTSISAHFTRPRRPIQLSYQEHGMTCEFTLATTGQSGAATNPAPPASRNASAAPMQPVSLDKRPERPARQPVSAQNTRQSTEMPPPPSRAPSARPQSGVSASQATRPPPQVPSASVDEQSLFVNDDDEDDRRWDEVAYDAQEDQLGWNDSYAPDQLRSLTQKSATGHDLADLASETEENEIPPTQSLTNMRGLFD